MNHCSWFLFIGVGYFIAGTLIDNFDDDDDDEVVQENAKEKITSKEQEFQRVSE
eukprot:Awhi_evm1s9167